MLSWNFLTHIFNFIAAHNLNYCSKNKLFYYYIITMLTHISIYIHMYIYLSLFHWKSSSLNFLLTVLQVNKSFNRNVHPRDRNKGILKKKSIEPFLRNRPHYEPKIRNFGKYFFVSKNGDFSLFLVLFLGLTYIGCPVKATTVRRICRDSCKVHALCKATRIDGTLILLQ